MLGSSSSNRMMPGESYDTLGKGASYSPTRDDGEMAATQPFQPINKGIRSLPSPGRAPPPQPTIRKGKFAGRMLKCTKAKVILAAIALVIILLLVIVLPLALTLGGGSSSSSSSSSASSDQSMDYAQHVQNPEEEEAVWNGTDAAGNWTGNGTEADTNVTSPTANITDPSFNGTDSTRNVTTPAGGTEEPTTESDRRTETDDGSFRTSTPAGRTSSSAGPTITAPDLSPSPPPTRATTPPPPPPSPSPSPPPAPPATRRAPSTSPPAPTRPRPPVTICSGYQFACRDGLRTIGLMKQCDGFQDCADGSDEENCNACRTSFFCPLDEFAPAGRKQCLRGQVICDSTPHCTVASALDETLYCGKSRCDPATEYHCQEVNICIPVLWLCDGDPQCPRGDDERFCSREMCDGGARYCDADSRCLPEWELCDGVEDCSDGSDEADCTCNECGGEDVVLCEAPLGRCIHRSKLCDGRKDCDGGEDETNCPGYCEPEVRLETVTCLDGRDYPRRTACSGLVPVCQTSCSLCDQELAFSCVGEIRCIPRSQVCDQIRQCADGSDEAEEQCRCRLPTSGNGTAGGTFSPAGALLEPYQCPSRARGAPADSPPKCIPALRLCDGYRDCPNGEDEVGCVSCYNSPTAFHCPITNQCFPSSSKCDGVVDCQDGTAYLDEDYCFCSDCKSQPYPTFMCKTNSRCLKTEDICSPTSPYHCPGSNPEDLQYCRRDFDPLNP